MWVSFVVRGRSREWRVSLAARLLPMRSWPTANSHRCASSPFHGGLNDGMEFFERHRDRYLDLAPDRRIAVEQIDASVAIVSGDTLFSALMPPVWQAGAASSTATIRRGD